jgi:hypothetical protein
MNFQNGVEQQNKQADEAAHFKGLKKITHEDKGETYLMKKYKIVETNDVTHTIT